MLKVSKTISYEIYDTAWIYSAMRYHKTKDILQSISYQLFSDDLM